MSQTPDITKYFNVSQHEEPGPICLVTSRRLYSLVPIYFCSLGQINALEVIASTNIIRNVQSLTLWKYLWAGGRIDWHKPNPSSLTQPFNLGYI